MIGLSLAILLVRIFQAHGSFLARVKVRTMISTPLHSNSLSSDEVKYSEVDFQDSILKDNGRSIFLPLDRKDGSNPKIQLEIPYPGIFIYRMKEGFNYANCFTQLDEMVEVIINCTQRGKPLTFERPGVN
jgi:solute carrier family 26 (sodium-independent sulfate anion transporter), member 11